MGNIYFSIPQKIVEKIHKKWPIEIFVETGTYTGITTFWAANVFKKVFTIEIDPEIGRQTAERHESLENITFLIGNSKDVLPELVKKITGSAFFWLDGHWCPGAGGKDKECLLLDEIKAIKYIQDPIIFIDDARLFMGPPPKPHNAYDWPAIDEIFAMLKLYFPNNQTTIHDDVIMCVPTEIKKILDEDWVENYKARFAKEKKKKGVLSIIIFRLKKTIKTIVRPVLMGFANHKK